MDVKEIRWQAPKMISGLVIIIETIFPCTPRFSGPSVLWGEHINFFMGLTFIHFITCTHRLKELAEKVAKMCRPPVNLVGWTEHKLIIFTT